MVRGCIQHDVLSAVTVAAPEVVTSGCSGLLLSMPARQDITLAPLAPVNSCPVLTGRGGCEGPRSIYLAGSSIMCWAWDYALLSSGLARNRG